GARACLPSTKSASRTFAANNEEMSGGLTLLRRCGCRPFSSRTTLIRGGGNKASTVFAENRVVQGSGNADSQPNGWNRREGGRSRRRSRDFGCVAAHPAPRRASPSYLPLRAGWAFAPGHSGVVRDRQTLPTRPDERSSKRASS